MQFSKKAKDSTKPKTETSFKSINKEITDVLTVLALPIFVIALSTVAIRYFMSLRSYNSKVITVSEQARDTATTNLDAVESLKKSLSDLESGDFGSREVLDALPSKYDYLAMATSIEKIVLQNGLTMNSFSSTDESDSVEQEAANPTPEIMEFSLGATGSYDEIQNLIDSFEKSIRPIQINSIKLSGEGASSMTVSINAFTYFQLSESLDITTKTIGIEEDVSASGNPASGEGLDPTIDESILDPTGVEGV